MITLDRIIDVHCHLMIFGTDERNGGFLHPKFQESLQTRTYLKKIGITNSELKNISDQQEPEFKLSQLYRERLLIAIEKSSANHVVVLPMDGIYDLKGNLEKQDTQWYVDNNNVLELARESTKILPAASINPMRGDWNDELEKCIEEKVALIKWLPSLMGFDPGNKKFGRFYQKVREAGIPILTHVGFEFAVPVVSGAYAEMWHLKYPLDEGVTVIAAHCCGGRPFIDSGEDFRRLQQMVEQYSNFYVDVAGMASAHRKSRLKRAVSDSRVRGRMVYGSDFPIPVHPWAFIRELGIKGYRKLQQEDNPFDRDIAIKKAVGLERDAFSRGYDLIGAGCLEKHGS